MKDEEENKVLEKKEEHFDVKSILLNKYKTNNKKLKIEENKSFEESFLKRN